MPAGRFVEALKKCLRARGMTYAALARELRISEASVKRMFSRSSFTLSRIEEILATLDLDLHEVARMSLASAAGPTELTLDQETALAKDERLISVFWLVLNGWRYEQIAEAFSISRAELTLVFARDREDRKSTRLNSSHSQISYAVFCLKKKKKKCVHINLLTRTLHQLNH